MSEVIRKSIQLLTALKPSEEQEEWSTTEISQKLDIPVQTVHRIYKCFSEFGFVVQNEKTKKFKLGLTLMELGLSITDNLSIRHSAMKEMENLSEKTRESVYLTIPEKTDGIFIECIDSPQLLKIVEPIGMRIPLSVGASKKVILAFEKPAERKQIIQTLQENNQIEDVETLEKDLAVIREQGFAVSQGETTDGTMSVAAPIFSWEDQVVASISLAGPENRFSGTRLKDHILQTNRTAIEISEKLGWMT